MLKNRCVRNEAGPSSLLQRSPVRSEKLRSFFQMPRRPRTQPRGERNGRCIIQFVCSYPLFHGCFLRDRVRERVMCRHVSEKSCAHRARKHTPGCTAPDWLVLPASTSLDGLRDPVLGTLAKSAPRPRLKLIGNARDDGNPPVRVRADTQSSGGSSVLRAR